MQSSHATAVSAPPEASTSPDNVCDGTPQPDSTEEHRQGSHTSRAPQLPSPGSRAALPCSNALQPNSDAVLCPSSASTVDSKAGSMTGIEAAGPLSESPLQPSAPHGQQPPGRPAKGAESMSERLQAVLKGPVSAAKALAVLAAVHTGAASLGLAAGLGRMPWPLYLIGTRDSFTHHLHAQRSRVSLDTLVTPSAVAAKLQKLSTCSSIMPQQPFNQGGLPGCSLPCTSMATRLRFFGCHAGSAG